MKRIFTLSLPLNFILTGALVFLLSGCAEYYYRQGNNLYDEMGYNSATNWYMKALGKKEMTGARERLAECYYQMNNYVKAEENYAKAMTDTVCPCQPLSKFHYAQVLMRSGKYDEAKKWFDQYLKAVPTDSAAMMLRASCDSVASNTQDSTMFTVELAKFNTEGATFSPTKYADRLMITAERSGAGNKIYEWTGRPFLDLMTVKPDGKGGWNKPESLKGDVNGKYHEGTAVIAPGDSVMYFTRNNYIKKKVGRSVQDVVNLKIYKAVRKDTVWTNITALPFNSNDYSCGHPTLTADGNTMYFVSDMPGGEGGKDIWMTNKTGTDSWSTPVNAGKTINTPFNEMFPVLQKDSVMFFSSEGHYSIGGLDVFRTERKNGEWTKPENMKTPVNSSSDDFGVMIKDTTILEGYVSSNRDHKDSGIDQIYHITRLLTFNLNGTVVDKETQKPIEGAWVVLRNKNTGVGIDSVAVGADGSFSFPLQPSTDYSVQATKEDYYTDIKEVSTVGKNKSENFTVKLELLTLWKPIVIRNILYDFDKANIRKDAMPILDNLVKVMNDNPKINVELSSHCDIRANYDYNMKLSQRRADSAVAYMVMKGVAASRITSKGYGWTKPFKTTKDDNLPSAPPGTELTPKFIRAIKSIDEQEKLHQLNRRTEFVVTKVDK